MAPNILALVQNCQWFPSHFLIISENVFSPLLYYSYFSAAIPVIIIGFLIFLNGKKKLENRLLFLITISLALWVFCALITWATEIPKYTMFSWTLLIILEPLISFFAFYFSFVFFFKRDFSLIQKIVFSLPLLPTIILASTKFSLLGYDLSNCDRAAIEGILVPYDYIVEIIFAILIIIVAIVAFRKITDKISRKKIVLVTIGITFFLLSFNLGNILETFTDNWYIGQYGLFGAPVFMAFLAYLIVKFKAFDVKLLGAQVLVWASVILIGVEFFFIQNNTNRVLTAITLVITAVLGLFIIRGVKKEIALREQVEGLAEDLEKTNFNLENANSNLEIANEKLKELDQLKTEFVSLTTHQIRGPLTALKGYASMILEGDFGEVSTKIKEPVNIIYESSQSLERVVEDFLDVSRIEQGKMKYDFAKIDFSELVKKVTEELKPTIAKTKLNFSFDVVGDNFTVNADKEKIKQVVLNFIDNSLKYTPSGSVKVLVENVVSNGKKVVRFSVKDTGVGIAKETLPKLFEKFSRAKDANKTNILGTGLGLYVAKKMVEAHNGKLWAESAGEGKGSQFYVELEVVK